MTWDKEAVRQLRGLLKLTQNEFADLLGCRQQTISEWEQGLYAPANAYGKLLTQLKTQTPGGFAVIPGMLMSEMPLPEEAQSQATYEPPEPKPFDPAVD